MKKLTIVRGAMEKPLVKQFDTFDSVVLIYSDSQDKSLSYRIENVNTDHSNGYKGGILAEGNYGGIVIDRKDTGRRAVLLFQRKYLAQVKTIDDVAEKMRVFKSLIPNPNQYNSPVITQVLIHQDGENGGWSHGCITIYPADWERFEKMFALGEILEIELVRYPTWTAPEIYQGK